MAFRHPERLPPPIRHVRPQKGLQLLRQQRIHRLANRLHLRASEHSLRGAVQHGDDAVPVNHDDRVHRRLKDAREPLFAISQAGIDAGQFGRSLRNPVLEFRRMRGDPLIQLPQCVVSKFALRSVTLDTEVSRDAPLTVIETDVVALHPHSASVRSALITLDVQSARIQHLAPKLPALFRGVREQHPRRRPDDLLGRNLVLMKESVIHLHDPLMIEHILQGSLLVDAVIPANGFVQHHEEEPSSGCEEQLQLRKGFLVLGFRPASPGRLERQCRQVRDGGREASLLRVPLSLFPGMFVAKHTHGSAIPMDRHIKNRRCVGKRGKTGRQLRSERVRMHVLHGNGAGLFEGFKVLRISPNLQAQFQRVRKTFPVEGVCAAEFPASFLEQPYTDAGGLQD